MVFQFGNVPRSLQPCAKMNFRQSMSCSIWAFVGVRVHGFHQRAFVCRNGIRSVGKGRQGRTDRKSKFWNNYVIAQRWVDQLKMEEKVYPCFTANMASATKNTLFPFWFYMSSGWWLIKPSFSLVGHSRVLLGTPATTTTHYSPDFRREYVALSGWLSRSMCL